MDLQILFALVGSIIGVAVGFFLRKKLVEGKVATAEESCRKIVLDAQKEAVNLKKESKLQAKEELYRAKGEFEKESRNKTRFITIRPRAGALGKTSFFLCAMSGTSTATAVQTL